MRIYLCGPIAETTNTEANQWRSEVKRFFSKYPEVVCVDPMDRDCRGVVFSSAMEAAEVVEADLADIRGSNIVLANCWKQSTGTPMEIRLAFSEMKRHVVVVAPGNMSPWLVYHSNAQYSNLQDALTYIEELVISRQHAEALFRV